MKEPLHLLDEIGWKILTELQQNARIPFAELGRRVGLSTPAVTERVHKMEEEGIIIGFRTQIDAAKVGLPILAFIRVKVDGRELSQFTNLASSFPEVLECHRITGAESFLLKAVVADVAHLETLLDALMPYEATTTSMVLSTALAWGNIAKPGSPPRAASVAKRRRRAQ
ncbi:MAG: Lrp/AsnC family transcriptional regulator [Candidatus Korobacteraceae bacterium]|jgi:Lrp/AsnC family leucine-responsive transcriptional regulator